MAGLGEDGSSSCDGVAWLDMRYDGRFIELLNENTLPRRDACESERLKINNKQDT